MFNEQARPDTCVHAVNLPAGGWLHTARQALGLSLKAVADKLKLSPQAIHQAEKSEASGTISLKQLEAVAGAMDCRLVYILIPRPGMLADQAVVQTEPGPRGVPPDLDSAEEQGVELPLALR